MSKQPMSAGTVARLGLLTAVALVLGYVEHLIPITAIPGIKLGLANTVLLYALYLLDTPSAILLMILKVGLGGLFYGGFAAMLYSLAGGILSLLVMILVKKARGVSVIGVSVCGAAAHNVGQILVACAVVGVRAALAYLPVLLVAAAVTGVLTGIIAKYVLHSFSPKTAIAQDQSAQIRKNAAAPQAENPGKKQGES
ncbi:MAG: Gx transporter family protein [Clostridiaceae bacterium]